MIEIGDEVYSTDGHISNETIFLTGAFEADAGIEALKRAADRFMSTGADGVEYEDIDVAYERSIYTPNYTSEPQVTEFGIKLYVDCKSVIEDPMRKRNTPTAPVGWATAAKRTATFVVNRSIQ